MVGIRGEDMRLKVWGYFESSSQYARAGVAYPVLGRVCLQNPWYDPTLSIFLILAPYREGRGDPRLDISH